MNADSAELLSFQMAIIQYKMKMFARGLKVHLQHKENYLHPWSFTITRPSRWKLSLQIFWMITIHIFNKLKQIWNKICKGQSNWPSSFYYRVVSDVKIEISKTFGSPRMTIETFAMSVGCWKSLMISFPGSRLNPFSLFPSIRSLLNSFRFFRNITQLTFRTTESGLCSS